MKGEKIFRYWTNPTSRDRENTHKSRVLLFQRRGTKMAKTQTRNPKYGTAITMRSDKEGGKNIPRRDQRKTQSHSANRHLRSRHQQSQLTPSKQNSICYQSNQLWEGKEKLHHTFRFPESTDLNIYICNRHVFHPKFLETFRQLGMILSQKKNS